MKSNAWLYTAVSCCLLGSVSAAAPSMAYFPAYTTVDESTFYIQGGSNVSSSADVYTQFYALDLTQSWNTSAPLWTEVKTTGPFPARLKALWHSISVSKDQKSLSFWNMYKPSFAIGVHIDNGSWTDMPAPPALKDPLLGVCKAVTDPTTDRVYIPGGADGNKMLVYDPVFKNTTTIAMPTGRNSTSWTYYTFAWNTVRRSFLLFGGLASGAELVSPGSPGPVLYEYSPAAAAPWIALNTSGAAPPMLAGSCMVSAHNGTKMLVFGGTFGPTMFGTLFILDVATMSWKQGPSSQPRLGMACSVSGDNFIVWGGTSWNNSATAVVLSDAPIIYNINSTEWTTTFVAKIKPSPTTTSAASTAAETKPVETGHSGTGGTDKGAETSSEESTNSAAIIGGSVGGGVLLLLLIAGGIFFCLRRRRAQQQQQGKEMQEEAPAKRTQFRIVQQPPTDETLEPTFYPSRPFRITPSTSHSNSNKNAQKSTEQNQKQDSWSAPSDWSSSPTQSVDSFSTPSTPTLDASSNPNTTNTTLLPQHYITLKPSQRARQR